MTAIERAKALLADTDLECTGVAYCTPCQRAEKADSTIREEAIATLRGYIGAVKALGGLMEIAETAMPDSYFRSDRRTKKARRIVSDFERLFPEAPASAD